MSQQMRLQVTSLVERPATGVAFVGRLIQV